MDTNGPTAGQPADAPKTYSLGMTVSLTGPGLPAKSGILEFARSLGRRELAIAAAALLFVFVVEPLVLFWLFSAKLKSRLDQNGAALTASISGQIQSEIGSAVREALSQQQQRVVTPLNAPDPTALVLPSAPPPPPPSGKTKP